MSVILQRNTVTARNQLELYLVDNINNPVNAAEISYTLYDMTSGVAVPIYQNADPVNPEVGEYYAAFFIPSNASLGRYRIQWSFRQLIGGPENLIQEEFEVVESVEQRFSITSGLVLDMVRRLRILLRDNNPARNARFRPPTHEGTINEYTRVFGYLWEDEELVEYLERGVDFVNLWPPLTGFNSIESMVQAQPAWRQTILMAAMSHALMALSIHWTSEDFSYSIGGISLDISKASQYESLKGNAESQLDKMLEAKSRTVKIIRGLQQSRYGLGVRSAFGPQLGAGIVSPARYVGIGS